MVHPPGGLVSGDTVDLMFSTVPSVHGMAAAESDLLQRLPCRKPIDDGTRAGAELIGWDVTAYGLPTASLSLALGTFCQQSASAPRIWSM